MNTRTPPARRSAHRAAAITAEAAIVALQAAMRVEQNPQGSAFVSAPAICAQITHAP
jgi:hypothetical protein